VDCSGAEGEEKTPEAAFVSKRTALLQLVDERPVSKTIVFCNKVHSSMTLALSLSLFIYIYIYIEA
jgi:ATP-dependent RNA helicase DDX18/HAS1